MEKVQTAFKKTKNYYKQYGFKRTCNAVWYQVKIRLFKGKVYVDMYEKYKNFDLNLLQKNNDCIYKTTKNIFIFGTVPYFDVGGGQRSSQFAKIFNRMGYSVYYIYAYECSETNIPMLSIPATYHKYVKESDYDEISEYVKEDDIFIFEAPIKTFEKYLGLAILNKCKIVYENIDNWETSLGNLFFSENTLKLMLNYADMIISTSKKLVQQTEEYVKKYCTISKPVYYLANAVDDELFEPRKQYEKPYDLITGNKTLLYYGSLWGEWFDWDIIKSIANSNEKISINLIGDYTPIMHIKEEMPSNVHFLGIKRQDQLPAYLKYSDFALLPFKPGKIGDYVSPLKIFEYISMDKYILATNLPDIQNYPKTFICQKTEDWIDKINNIDVTISNKDETSKRDVFISNNNWYSRCSIILDVLFPENSSKLQNEAYDNLSIIVLNYNNKNVIFKNVDTLLYYRERYNYQIVVVDNMSTDGSYETLQNNYTDKITLVRNTKNGCSSGRNLGVQNATGKYILFLDSDEWILNKYWLDNYINLLVNNKDIGAIGWGAGWFNKEGFAYNVVDSYEFKFMPPNVIARQDIGYLATCGFIMRKDLFNKIEGFDENYDPTCYEDTDLSLKIRHAGFGVYYSSYLGIGHLPHQTTKSGTEAHDKLIRAKGEYFLNKWTKINKNLIFNYVK